MNPNHALFFAHLVDIAYGVSAAVLPVGAAVPVQPIFGPSSYVVETAFYGSDLANDLNVLRGRNVVPFGYVMRDQGNNVVVAIRGTEGVYEWLHDFYFLYEPFSYVPSAGNTEDGFTTIYGSLRIAAAVGAQSLLNYLVQSHIANPFSTLTICGHSLGGALATLLALAYAVKTASDPTAPEPDVYTYASPHVGDVGFVTLYDHMVPTNFRIANRADIVPKLPLPPMYQHVAGLVDLNPTLPGPPPSTLINFNIPCEHILSSYMFLLSRLPGVLPALQEQFVLDPACSAAHGAGLALAPAGGNVAGIVLPQLAPQ